MVQDFKYSSNLKFIWNLGDHNKDSAMKNLFRVNRCNGFLNQEEKKSCFPFLPPTIEVTNTFMQHNSFLQKRKSMCSSEKNVETATDLCLADCC